MGSFRAYETLKHNQEQEFLHVNQRLGKIKAGVISYTFQDKDTKQYISFIPSLDISGYGSTKKKAHEMLKQAVDDFNEFLIKLPV